MNMCKLKLRNQGWEEREKQLTVGKKLKRILLWITKRVMEDALLI